VAKMLIVGKPSVNLSITHKLNMVWGFLLKFRYSFIFRRLMVQ
jgi:hypothetical protein